MNIQLLQPPIYINPRALQSTRPALPLGLAYLAASLREAGHSVSVLDALAEAPEQLTNDGELLYYGLRPEEIVERINPEAQVIGVSVEFSFMWPLARRIIRQIRERYPEKILVGGGEHFTGLPEYALRQAPLDYVVLGEGEATCCALLSALEAPQGDPAKEAGLAFLREGRYHETPRRDRIRDLDRLPLPAWDLFAPEIYYRHRFISGIDTGMSMPILATRGCPYACTYCSNPLMWRQRWYARDPIAVVDEMQAYYHQYHAVNFPLQDLTAILKRPWIKTFCQEIIRRKLPITWQFPVGTRSEVIDDEIARLLKASGVASIALAPESGSKEVRRRIKKMLDEPAFLKAARAALAQGLDVSTFFVMGFPEDRAADMRQSMRLAVKLAWLGVSDISLNTFFPIPGSELYQELCETGELQLTDELLLAPIRTMDPTVHKAISFCRHLSARQLTCYRYKILLLFYLTAFISHPTRLLRTLWHVWRNEESCRLEAFLIIRKRALLQKLRQGKRS